MADTLSTDWTLIPGTDKDIASVRERCRRMVRRRATVAAGFSAVPLPGPGRGVGPVAVRRLVEEVNERSA